MRAMLPLVGVPPTLTRLLSNYRDLFCRHQGFAHVGRESVKYFGRFRAFGELAESDNWRRLEHFY